MDVTQVLKAHQFKFNKRYGQNFITDKNLLSAIVSDAAVTQQDTVVEIGAGAGTLTAALAVAAKKVISFEIDHHLKDILATTLQPFSNVEMVFSDVMKYDKSQLNQLTNGKYKLVANLPYYITTPIIFLFLYDPNVTSITIMVQKEVAQRICAVAGTAAYGALSAQVQAVSDPKLTRVVSKKMFMPVPEVDSAIVTMALKSTCEPTLLPLLKRVIAAAFAMRRKTLVNNLTASFSISREQAIQVVTQCNKSETARGETFSVQEFITLAEKLQSIL